MDFSSFMLDIIIYKIYKEIRGILSMNLSSMKKLETNNISNSLNDLVSYVSSDMEKVNQVLRDKMDSPVSLIPTLAGHLIRSGGKRLRPMLTAATSKLFNYKGERHISLAACVEFIHTATLLHDDVVDESDMRRGQESANAIWGNKSTVLVGDFLFTRSFELMVADENINVMRILSKAASTVVEGEVLQLLTGDDLNTPESDYYKVMKAKTSALFSAACEVSAAIVNASDEKHKALREYGENLGVTFQLIDDMLDYLSDSETLGKNAGDDFREGKVTLPIILSYQVACNDEKDFWKRTMTDMDQQQGDFEKALKYLNKHQIFSIIQNKANEYAKKAAECLEVFEDSEIKSILQRLAFYCVDRNY